jgi:serine/threonine protein kinase
MSSSDTAPPPSYLLEKRYLAEERLGRGETTDVFRGTDTWSGELVAIRVLREDRLERESIFRRRAERLFGFASSRIVRPISLGDTQDGRPFLVTELLVGRSAETFGRLRWEVACEISRQAARALVETHLHGLVHGELRPSKLFVARSSAGGSRVKLLDLGIGGRNACDADDVAALVRILYRFLTGVDWTPENAVSGVRATFHEAPPRLDELLHEWLNAGPEKPLTASDVAEGLQEIVTFASGQFILPRPSRASFELVAPSWAPRVLTRDGQGGGGGGNER